MAGPEIVREAGGWSVFIPGVPIAADGATIDAAITDMIQALHEYSEDWHERLSSAPNHRVNRQLVEMVSRSDDAQLRDWLVGSSASRFRLSARSDRRRK